MKGNIYISGIIDKNSDPNYLYGRTILEEELNNHFDIQKYSSELKKLGVIYKAFAENGVIPHGNHDKKYKRKDKALVLYLSLSYNDFVNANKELALRLMSELYLVGINLFLLKWKDFDCNNFYKDVEKLFAAKKWITTNANN